MTTDSVMTEVTQYASDMEQVPVAAGHKKAPIAEALSNNRLPMFSSAQALLSLRDSGYDLAAALGEPLDNSIESGAQHIWLRFDEEKVGKKKQVHRIVIADDGGGMTRDILHHYPIIGFGTRLMRKDTIGKYGVGAKLAALNFGKRLDTWSRADVNDPWLHVYFDLDEAKKDEEAGRAPGLDEPQATPVPDDLKDMLPAGTGTLVVWSKVDRLEDGRTAENFDQLRIRVERELGRIFRHYIDAGREIYINGSKLYARDPLMLIQGSWYDMLLNKHYGTKDEHYGATVVAETHELEIAGHKVHVTVTMHPENVVRTRGTGRDELARKLDIPDNLGKVSFVRLNREVSYTIVPKLFRFEDVDFRRYIGIEVAFTPELDAYFGIRNVKRGVEPHGELREKLRKFLSGPIEQAEKQIRDMKDDADRKALASTDELSQVMEALKESSVEALIPKVVQPPVTEAARQQVYEEAAFDAGYEEPAAVQQYIDRIKDLPYVLQTVSYPGKTFISTVQLGDQVFVKMNKRHPFYQMLWEPIRVAALKDPHDITQDEMGRLSRKTIQALSLLMAAYGRAEAMQPHLTDEHEELLTYWGNFLSTMMKMVKIDG